MTFQEFLNNYNYLNLKSRSQKIRKILKAICELDDEDLASLMHEVITDDTVFVDVVREFEIGDGFGTEGLDI